MTATPIEVEDWIKGSKSFKPVMTAEVAAPAETALQAIAHGLAGQDYRVKDGTPTGFRATYRELVGGILGVITVSDFDILERTVVTVEATPTAGGTLVRIAASGKTEDRRGRKRGRLGLTAGLQELQRRGISVTTTPWTRPSG